jgi:hypothetical protein
MWETWLSTAPSRVATFDTTRRTTSNASVSRKQAGRSSTTNTGFVLRVALRLEGVRAGGSMPAALNEWPTGPSAAAGFCNKIDPKQKDIFGDGFSL